MPDLEILELLYSPVTDAAVEHLAALPKVTRLRLIGSQITAAGIERLQQLAAQTDIDYRNGGFLGISCNDNPVASRLVQPNSAAAAAGFQVDDIITRYNDQPVQTMDELTRLISQHTRSATRSSVELLRNNERITPGSRVGSMGLVERRPSADCSCSPDLTFLSCCPSAVAVPLTAGGL